MKCKKIFAAVLALVMLLTVLPMTAFAASSAPSALYVGEYLKAKDNLIDKYNAEGTVTVYSVKDGQNYYQLTFEKNVGYVLTFYNAYAMSAVVSKGDCGLYCDGDLTVRLAMTNAYAAAHPGKNASITFDLNEKYINPDDQSEADTAGACGWIVKGTLTVECLNAVSPRASLTINGDLTQSEFGCIGIQTGMLLLNNVTVTANGGNIGVKADEAIGMINATLNANTDAKLNKGKDRLFFFSVSTDNLLEVNSAVAAPGTLDIDAYYGVNADNSKLEEDPVVYARAFEFDVTPAYYGDVKRTEKRVVGNWRSGFNLFRNPSLIPGCVKLVNPSSVGVRNITKALYDYNCLSISGNRATIRRPTTASGVTLGLVLVCGSASFTMDTCRVIGTVRWWQVIPYFLSGEWFR